jgi:NDP-sugar pyrophosphorylase family protein
VKVHYSVGDEFPGTGGALKNSEGLLRNEHDFIAVNSDILTSLNPIMLSESRHVALRKLMLGLIPGF